MLPNEEKTVALYIEFKAKFQAHGIGLYFVGGFWSKKSRSWNGRAWDVPLDI